MNVYSGNNRRQIGGGIWSTLWRGLKPILKHLGETLKPIGKQVAKRTAKSVIDVGSSLATDALIGKLDKSTVKNKIRNEANQLKEEGFRNLKRKLGMQEGEGIRRKRRRITKELKSQSKTTKPQRSRRRRRRPTKINTKRKGAKKHCKRSKKCINMKQSKRKRATSRKSSVSRKAIKDIFG